MAQQTVGWIGTGVMGASMCAHILNSGYRLFVYNRTKEKACGLVDKGAVWCDSVQKLAAECNIVFSIVGYPEDVEEVILSDNGVIRYARSGTIIVDMTTSSPHLAEKIHRAAAAKGISALDAPVSGGDIGARNATLAIMVGGDKPVFDEILPFFRIIGENVAHMGPCGKGQHTKMCNQILIASNMIGVVESLLYANASGISMNDVIDVIGKGAASSWSINNLGKRIADGDFGPGFYIKHFIKDMGIALEEAKRMRLSLPGLALANQFYLAAASLGWEELGTQGLYKVFEKLNNRSAQGMV